MSLKQKAVNGFGWTVFEGVLSQGVLFIVGIILARLLTPKDFGIIGIISVFVAISSSFVEGGLGSALIRKPNVSDKDFNTVFYTNIFVSIFIYFLIYTFSFKIAEFFDESSLEKILKVSGLIVIINSFSIIHGAILTINLNFKIISIVNIIASSLSAIVALYMAYNGYGVWSLVMLSILRPLINCILLWFLNSWKPSFVFAISSFKELFDFGYKMLVSNLINTLYQNIYYFLIGKFFSPVTLGYYTRANQFQAPFSVNITLAISRISFPILASFQNDNVQLRKVFRKFLRFSALINFTILLSIAAIAKPLVLLTIGDKWETSILYLQILCIPGTFYPLQILNISLITALGHSNLFLKLEIIKKLILVPLILLTAFFSIEIMLYGLVLFSITEFFINSFYAKKLIGYSVKEQINDIYPFLLIALAVFLPMFLISLLNISLVKMLALQLPIGALTFCLINEKLKLNEYLEIKSNLFILIKKLMP
tara:strand:- start:1263 stop:2708 length:1446 start_codon:yes stop_codon:yes gene_type:complete